MSLFKRIKNIIRSNINFDSASSNWSYENYEGYTSQNDSFHDDTQQQNTEFYQQKTNDIEKEYYGNLELPYGVGFDEIKKAYRKLLKKYHPDKFHNDERKLKIAQDVVKKLNIAYEYFEKKYN